MRTTWNFRRRWGRSCKDYSKRVGALDKTCGLIPVGLRAIPLEFTSTQQSWLRSRQTSFWHMVPRWPLLQATRSVPIVSPVFGDPVRSGFVDSLARPGGNVTGFVSFEYGMAAKWLTWALARTRRFRPKARTWLRPRS